MGSAVKTMDNGRTLAAARAVISGFLALLFCYAAFFVPLPYYIFQPGTADDLQGMVRVQGGGYPESGRFLLTTVGVSNATLAKMAEARFKGYEVRRQTAVRQPGESEQEYGERQHQVMLTSQSNAIQAAYRAAGISYTIANKGIVVLGTVEGLPAEGVLEPGDVILKADGAPVDAGSKLDAIIAGKKEGDAIRLTYKRGSVAMEASFTLRALPAAEQGTGQLGIGIATADRKAVQAARQADGVTVRAGEIGGPSAGFMFALETYGLLLADDLSRGYTIAGTGTIDPQGVIGAIGGARHKATAAHRAGADILFVPRDEQSAGEARKQAEKLHSAMKVVEVGTLQEAIAYLESLPPKAAG
ncbi:signal protein PDZ [Paenibacillus sp. YN15]|nr:signal protein PDZ [Paenibacillus sp. YN15]